MENPEFSLGAGCDGLPDFPPNAPVQSGPVQYQALGGGAESWLLHRTLAGGAGGADVVLAVLLQKTPSSLGDANAVAMEPFLTTVTADHEPGKKKIQYMKTGTDEQASAVQTYLKVTAKHT